MKEANLTRRENEIAELIAWGATKKEVAQKLYISYYTVDNTIKSIFAKAGVTKVNELSAWWFCTRFHISMDLSPLKRSIVSIVLLIIVFPAELAQEMATLRGATTTSARPMRSGRSGRSRRSKEYEIPF